MKTFTRLKRILHVGATLAVVPPHWSGTGRRGDIDTTRHGGERRPQESPLRRLQTLGVALVGAALVAQAAMAGDTPVDRRSLLPRVQRTWMPEASPSSFAVGFSNGMNLCFDPERGQVVYAWQGDFVDMKPTLEIKFPQDAKIRGSIFHRTPQDAFSNPDATRAEVRFTGYRVRANEVVFQFKIGNLKGSNRTFHIF